MAKRVGQHIVESVDLSHNILKNSAALVHGSRPEVRPARVTLLPSIKVGPEAKYIASLTRSMVTEVGDNVSDEITLTNSTSKGGRGWTILMRPAMREAPVALKTARIDKVRTRLSAIHEERGQGTSGALATVWCDRSYSGFGLTGRSSHCGRRTIITRPAQEIVEMGGSLRDVRQLAGHTNIRATRPAIEGNPKPRSKVFALI